MFRPMWYIPAEGDERSQQFKVRTQAVLREKGGLAFMQRLIFLASHSVSDLPHLSERHSSVDPVGLAYTPGLCWRRRVCLDGLARPGHADPRHRQTPDRDLGRGGSAARSDRFG